MRGSNPPAVPGSAGRNTVLKAATILLAGAWAYLPVWKAGFAWDDPLEVSNNPVLGSPGGLWKTWFSPPTEDYYPLKTTFEWFEWHLWRAQPLGYHLANLGLHMAGALLLWRLLARLGVRAAWIGGLLFAVHPLAVESVAWVSELKNTLSLPLLLMAMLVYIDFERRQAGDVGIVAVVADPGRPASARPVTGDLGGRRQRGRPQQPRPRNPPSSYWLSVALFAASLLCKSSGVMFPVVILLYAAWRRGRIAKRDLIASAPFFALSMAAGATTAWFQIHRAIGKVDIGAGGLSERIASAGIAVSFYLAKCVVPVRLLPAYPRWAVAASTLSPWLPGCVAAAVGLWLWSGRSPWRRHARFGISLFFLNLLPVLGVMPMAYLWISRVGDQLCYLSLAAVVGLAAAGLAEWGFNGRFRRLAIAGAAALCAAMAVEAERYASAFRSDETLWTFDLQSFPDSWLAHNNLANVYLRDGRMDAAISQFERVLELKPGFTEAENDLGTALSAVGRTSEAIGRFEEVLRLDPDYAEAHNNLGNAFSREGRSSEAIDQYEAAIRINPDYFQARDNLGIALARLGRAEEAAAQFEQVVRISPGFPEGHANLALALAHLGRIEEAEAQAQEANRLASEKPAGP